jgi:hypothetical protein
MAVNRSVEGVATPLDDSLPPALTPMAPSLCTVAVKSSKKNVRLSA